jgi:hypothetical protein
LTLAFKKKWEGQIGFLAIVVLQVSLAQVVNMPNRHIFGGMF